MPVLPLDKWMPPGESDLPPPDQGGGGIPGEEPEDPDPPPYDPWEQAFFNILAGLTLMPTIYEMITLGLRMLDEQSGTRIIERFCERPQQLRELWTAEVESLKLTDSPETCPAELLPYLAAHVGFNKQLAHIVDRLDEPTLRKLIALGIPFWRQKGTASGLVAAIRTLTGLTPFYSTWFDYRWIIGETMLGEDQIGTDSWFIGTGNDYDEYTSQIKLMDDGTLDEQLLLDLASLMRPISEEIEIVLLDFLDLFDAPRIHWTTRTGTPATVDTTEQVFNIPPSTWEEAIVTVVPQDSYTNYNIVAQARFQETEGIVTFRWYRQTASTTSRFRLTLTPDFAGNGYNVLLRRTGTTLYSGPAIGGITLVAGAWYTVRIETRERPDIGATSHQIRVWIDNTLQADIITTSTPPTAGAFGIQNDSATSLVSINNVELWRHPLRYALVAGSGTTYTDSFFQE